MNHAFLLSMIYRVAKYHKISLMISWEDSGQCGRWTTSLKKELNIRNVVSVKETLTQLPREKTSLIRNSNYRNTKRRGLIFFRKHSVIFIFLFRLIKFPCCSNYSHVLLGRYKYWRDLLLSEMIIKTTKFCLRTKTSKRKLLKPHFQEPSCVLELGSEQNRKYTLIILIYFIFISNKSCLSTNESLQVFLIFLNVHLSFSLWYLQCMKMFLICSCIVCLSKETD